MILFSSRWDIQQLRQERMQENLRQRQREREDQSQLKTQSTADDIKVKCLHPPGGNGESIKIFSFFGHLYFGLPVFVVSWLTTTIAIWVEQLIAFTDFGD